METRDPIGWVEATVRFPLFAGDKTEGVFDWFEYNEPGITPKGNLAVCKRKVTVLKSRVVMAEPEKTRREA